MRILLLLVALAATTTLAFAQQTETAPAAPATAPMTASIADTPTAAAAPVQVTLPANSEVLVGLTDNLSSKKAKLGDKFKFTTLENVSQDGVIVIPKGTSGEGTVTYRKGTGSFGKSAKLELSFNSLDLNGKKVALAGKFRDEGKGNGGAAVGGVVAAGIIGGLLVHGHSIEVNKGQVLHAHTVDSLTSSS